MNKEDEDSQPIPELASKIGKNRQRVLLSEYDVQKDNLNGVQELLVKYAKAQPQYKPKIIEEMIKIVSEKFEEFILDESEIIDIMKTVDIILAQKDINIMDKLDMIYKNAKLYFKESNKKYCDDHKSNNSGTVECRNSYRQYGKILKQLYNGYCLIKYD